MKNKKTCLLLISIFMMTLSFTLQKNTIMPNKQDDKYKSNILSPLLANISIVYEWNRTWGGNNDDRGYAIVLDSSENIYLAGYTESFAMGWCAMCLVKYDSSGVQQWNCTWGGSFNDYSRAIALDSLENIYLAGHTSSFGTGSSDMCLVKYDSLGVQQWNHTWGGSGYDYGKAITLDSSENIYLAGYTNSSGAGRSDICLVKYKSDLVFPQITINSPAQNEIFGSATPNFDLSIIEENLDAIWYTIDGGTINITCGLSGQIDQTEWNKKGNDTVTIRFSANDTVGNEGCAEVVVQKDTYAPTSSISFIPHNGTNIVNKSTIFTLSADDGLGSGISMIKYKINDSDWINYNGSFNLSGYAFGDYLISYYATDGVGNVEEIKTLLVELVEVPTELSKPTIFGYELILLIGVICAISLILIRKRYKLLL